MPQPVKSSNHYSHYATAVKFNPASIRKAVGQVEGFNAKVAVIITSGVGTMADRKSVV